MAGTYKDIRRLTGLSLSTISKYFNGKNMRPESRAAVEKAIEDLDFRVNEYARGLKSRKSRTIGVLAVSFDGVFVTRIISLLSSALRERGYSMLVCDCQGKPENKAESMCFLLDRMVDGVITLAGGGDESHLLLAKERGIPVLTFDAASIYEFADVVMIDNVRAAALAGEEFLRNGHRTFGIVAGPQDRYTMRCRVEGFMQSVQGMAQRITTMTNDLTLGGGYQAVMRMYAQGGPRPTALFTANYDTTLGTVVALNELGVRIGQDVSLIGFDNLSLTGVINPTLTMIVQPMDQIAFYAAQGILARLESPTAPRSIRILQAELVRGGSVKKLH